MKTLLISIAICSFTISFSQNFAPVGATWHYGETWMGPGSSFLKIESVQDSLFNGKNCRLLLKNRELQCEGRTLQVLVYDEDSVAYFWDEAFDEFQILYDLKKQIGESWNMKIRALNQNVDTIAVMVTNVTTTILNSVSLKQLEVLYSTTYNTMGIDYSWTSSIIESIGDTTFLFNFHPESIMYCDMNLSSGLRCYEDENFGFYSTNASIACDYNTLSLVEKGNNDFTISPNPAKENIFIETKLNDFENFKIQLINSLGEIVIEANSQNNIDVSSLSCGVYIFNLISNQNSFSEKIVILK